MTSSNSLNTSFCDPSGFLVILAKAKKLILRQEHHFNFAVSESVCRALQLERQEFTSSTYEWSFSRLVDAARLTRSVKKQTLAQWLF